MIRRMFPKESSKSTKTSIVLERIADTNTAINDGVSAKNCTKDRFCQLSAIDYKSTLLL